MEKSTKIGIGIFLFILIGGYFIVSGSDKPTTDSTNNEVREITIDAKRFEFSHPVIEVAQGERVRIKINNQDTTHGIFIPDLNVNGIDSVEFTADRVGEFPYRCATKCGSGHLDMTGKIVVK
jgi:cytochrome c oxidase subunit II